MRPEEAVCGSRKQGTDAASGVRPSEASASRGQWLRVLFLDLSSAPAAEGRERTFQEEEW